MLKCQHIVVYEKDITSLDLINMTLMNRFMLERFRW